MRRLFPQVVKRSLDLRENDGTVGTDFEIIVMRGCLHCQNWKESFVI